MTFSLVVISNGKPFVSPTLYRNIFSPSFMISGVVIFVDITTSENVIGLEGSYAVAIGHADNVRQLHEQLFGETGYQPSDEVQQISQDVAYLTGVYPENYAQ